MKKYLNKKRILMGMTAFFLLVIIVCVGKSLATSKTQGKMVKLDGLSFENPSVSYSSSKQYSTFSVDVYNETKETMELDSIDIVLTNNKGNVIRLTQEIDKLEADEGRKIIIERVAYDLREYKDITYEINK